MTMPDPTPTHSPLPWHTQDDLVMDATDDLDGIVADCGDVDEVRSHANAALICAAVNERPGLLRRVEELERLMRRPGVLMAIKWSLEAATLSRVSERECRAFLACVETNKEPSHATKPGVRHD
jgi:hypothetical protein